MNQVRYERAPLPLASRLPPKPGLAGPSGPPKRWKPGALLPGRMTRPGAVNGQESERTDGHGPCAATDLFAVR